MNELFDVKGKVALITGSTRGIGFSTAETLARAGAKVVISSRTQEACEKAAGQLKEQGLDVLALPCHIGHKAQLQDLVDQTLDHWGRIDILVCNAATNPAYGPLSELTDAAYDKIMDTNVKSTFWLCNRVLPIMAQQGGGSVILLSSVAALKGTDKIGCYGMSKAAEASLARNLAVEWGPSGIRVNAIAPGVVVTDFAQALVNDPKRKQIVEQQTPLRRLGDPQDIAGIVHFLAAPASAYMTGQVLVADGGQMMGV